MPTIPPLPAPSTESPAFRRALEERRPFLLAMEEAHIERQPKVDASAAAETVIGNTSQIALHRAEMVALFGANAGVIVDRLLVVARATKQADVDFSAAEAIGDLSPLEVDLRAEHALLLNDAQSLVYRGLLSAHRLEPARGAVSYRQLIHSALVLVSVMRENWSRISGHTPITEADLDRTENKANHMLTTLGERDQGVTRVPALEVRLRALSALVRDYDEVRRMITYLRWHEDDGDEIAPSLYARRTRSRRESEEETGETPRTEMPPRGGVAADPTTPAVPGATGTREVMPTRGTPTQPTTTTSPAAPASGERVVAPTRGAAPINPFVE